jgi:tight adherence protein B
VTDVGLPLAALVGGGLGAGVLLLVRAIAGDAAPPSGLAPPRRTATALAAVPRDLAVGFGVAAVVGLLTGWPIAAVLAGVAGYLTPATVSRRAATKEAILRLEALAAWTESVRDDLAAAAGLEQAVVATAQDANNAIGPQAAALVRRLQRDHLPLADALRALADDLDDPEADAVVGALLMAVEHQGAQVGESLSALADSAWERAIFYRRTDAVRAEPRTEAKVIVGVFVSLVLLLSVFGREFLDVYNQATGQLVLLFVGACYFAGHRWLAALASTEAPTRFIHGGRRR